MKTPQHYCEEMKKAGWDRNSSVKIVAYLETDEPKRNWFFRVDRSIQISWCPFCGIRLDPIYNKVKK